MELFLVGLVLCLVIASIFYKNLWPLVAALLMLVIEEPLVIFAYGFVLNFSNESYRINKKIKNIFPHITVLSLMGLLLSFNFSQNTVDGLSLFLIPFVYYYPVKALIQRDSGAQFALLSLCFVSVLEIFIRPDSVEGLTFLILYGLVLILYKSLPDSIVLTLMLGMASLGVYLVIHESYDILILLSFLFGYLILQKTYEAKKACIKKRSAWFSQVFMVLAMMLSGKASLNMVGLLACCGLVYMASQKLCNVCIFALRCKEIVLLQFAILCPLLFFLTQLNASGLNRTFTPWLVFMSLAVLHFNKQTASPLNSHLLLSNPCVRDYEQKKG